MRDTDTKDVPILRTEPLDRAEIKGFLAFTGGTLPQVPKPVNDYLNNYFA